MRTLHWDLVQESEVDFEIRPGFKSLLHYLPAVWPCLSYLTSLSFRVLICFEGQ